VCFAVIEIHDCRTADLSYSFVAVEFRIKQITNLNRKGHRFRQNLPIIRSVHEEKRKVDSGVKSEFNQRFGNAIGYDICEEFLPLMNVTPQAKIPSCLILKVIRHSVSTSFITAVTGILIRINELGPTVKPGSLFLNSLGKT